MFSAATFITQTVDQAVPLLFGSTGEIITEKSGNLNLGIPGVMYVGAISGVIGAFGYEQNIMPGLIASGNDFLMNVMTPALGILIPMLTCLLGSALMGLLYCFLTVTLRANQNVTGLALTTFGVGFGNFFGGSLIKLVGSDVSTITVSKASAFFTAHLPFADSLGWFGEVFLSYGFLVYLSIIIALITAHVFNHSRVGLHLRAVGESPATADAAGIDVIRYKYTATIAGCMIAGLGGLFYIMDSVKGSWSNDAFGDRGWLSIALVIFATWRPRLGILTSILFGALSVLYVNASDLNLPTFGLNSMAAQQFYRMIPYLVTLIVLVVSSISNKREKQPPASLGLPYFREER